MGNNNYGFARCSHCGAEYRLFTIFNRDMQGLCKAWKGRHEHACEKRTPAQRRKWAKPYIGKDTVDSSIVVDMTHRGFADRENPFDGWYYELEEVAAKRSVSVADRDAWVEPFQRGLSPEEALDEEYATA